MKEIDLPSEFSNWVLGLVIKAKVVFYLWVIGLRNHSSAGPKVKKISQDWNYKYWHGNWILEEISQELNYTCAGGGTLICEL